MLTAAFRGFSIIELMVAMALGMVAMSAALSIYLATVRSNTDMLKTVRLEEELAAAMQYMMRDLRRAGYAPARLVPGGVTPPKKNRFQSVTVKDRNDDGHYDCILYTYDYDADDTIDDGTDSSAGEHPDERLGFRLDFEHNAIERRRSGRGCDASRWEDLTDPRVVRVTTLRFDLTRSTTPFAEDEIITGRLLTIFLQAQLSNDPAVEQTLQGTVRIRNDAIGE